MSLLVSYQSLAISSTLTGMQLGDDAAPLTIVEYRSLTCSHCADFSNNIFPEIKEKNKTYEELTDFPELKKSFEKIASKISKTKN